MEAGMKYRTWPVLVIAFGTLVVLIAVSGVGALRRSRQIYDEISALNESYNRTDAILNEVQVEIHVMGVLIRDYLLDVSNISADRYRTELREVRLDMTRELDELGRMLGEEERPRLERLRSEVEAYWTAYRPLFEWTPRQKMALSGLFLRKQVLPRRDAALAIAGELRELAKANLKEQQSRIDRKQRELPVDIGRMLGATLLLGLLVAGVSVFRITLLERRSEEQHERATIAGRELRRLSQQLVRAQEDERKSISRELHDEVGQMLTALRMELRNLQELRQASAKEFDEHLDETKQLSEQALRAVRHIAMGLRPSMLDDLGLGPAVQWQAREFSRRSGVPVTVDTEGDVNELSERHRTCVYRVVQEALTNCARHARASEIRITLHGEPGFLTVTVQDDGAGFDPAQSRGRGLGLLSIEERVSELGGSVSISSQPGKGTVLSARVPLGKGAAV
jgi:signal transduction histidine kinase